MNLIKLNGLTSEDKPYILYLNPMHVVAVHDFDAIDSCMISLEDGGDYELAEDAADVVRAINNALSTLERPYSE